MYSMVKLALLPLLLADPPARLTVKVRSFMRTGLCDGDSTGIPNTNA